MRSLTSQEEAFVALVRAYERAVEARQHSFVIKVSKEGMYAIYKGEMAGYFKTMTVAETKDENGQTIFFVRMWLHEFEKYMHFVLQQAGMAFLPNYKMVMPDGFMFEI